MTTTTLPEPPVSRGDVVLVLFPNSNLRTAKTRPALVVQRNQLQTGLSQVVVAMITSQMFRVGHPSRVTILLSTVHGRQSGLLADSVVMTDNLATITNSAVNRVVGSLPMTEVDDALRHTLGL
jgi:mRNA interferase MazF